MKCVLGLITQRAVIDLQSLERNLVFMDTGCWSSFGLVPMNSHQLVVFEEKVFCIHGLSSCWSSFGVVPMNSQQLGVFEEGSWDLWSLVDDIMG